MDNKTQKLLESELNAWLAKPYITDMDALNLPDLLRRCKDHISAGIDSRNELVAQLKEAREIIDDYYFGELCDDDVANSLKKIDGVIKRAEASAIDDGGL